MSEALDTLLAYARRMRGWGASAVKEGKDDLWKAYVDAIETVAAELQVLTALSKPVPASYGDLSDLPPELLAQLSGVKTDALEDKIYGIVKAAGDEIELDRLLIELFRRHGDVLQRRFLNNKCYRMAQKGLIHIVRGRKGVYSIQPQAPDEFEELLGFSSTPTKAAAGGFSADLDDEIPF